MLQCFICFLTSGHTDACTSLYRAAASGFSRTICAMRRPGFLILRGADGDEKTSSPLVGGLLVTGEVGFCHISAIVSVPARDKRGVGQARDWVRRKL